MAGVSARKAARAARLPGLALAAFLGVCAACPSSALLAQEAPFSNRLDAILERPAARRAFWGIHVVRLRDSQVIYAHNAEKLFVPASNAKLFSTALGMEKLGPAYRFTTSIVVEDEEIGEDGVLRGDLVLLGGGDPNLSARVVPYRPDASFGQDSLAPIKDLARQVVAAGLREVRGNILGDDRRYVWQRFGTGWSAEDPTWGYGAPASALSFNDNILDLIVLPGAAVSQPSRITLRPELPFFSIDNQSRTAPSRRVARRLEVDREAGTRTVRVWGEIPLRSPGRKLTLAVDDPAAFAAAALRAELERLGVRIQGSTLSRHLWPHEVTDLRRGQPPAPRKQVLLASRESAPLADSITVINKESQNLHAEMLLREVGYMQRGIGSFEAGIEELDDFLVHAGLKPWDFHFEDGSGLSRQNLVSPEGTVRLLQYVWQAPWRDVYLKSLPVAGEDGTLDWRFSRTPANGQIHAKTGTLTHVTALSGYARTLRGEDLAFSILVNNFGVPTSYIRKLVDEIAVAIVDGAPAAVTPVSVPTGTAAGSNQE